MGIIKVETFDVSPSTDGTTHTLSNDVGAVTNAFVKVNGAQDKASGPAGSTGNAGPRDSHMGVSLTGTNQITFHKGGTVQMRKMGEVWRYTGAPGGLDEFIVRGHLSVTLGTGVSSNTATPTGIVNRNRVVPFLTGLSNTSTSVNDYDAATVAVFINSSGDLEVSRQSTGIAVTVYVSVVEFTGSNWTIAHAISSNHDTSAEIVSLNSDSTGSGGSTVDIDNWGNAFIEGSMQGDTSETGLSDNLIIMEPGSGTTQVRFFLQQDNNARNDGDAYAHVVHNPGMVVTREYNNNFPETNGTAGTTGFPVGTSLGTPIDELALEWFADTSGVGTAHARGRVIARITASTGTITHWVHRSGNSVAIGKGVINLANITGFAAVSITSAPTQIDVGDNDITISGANFESAQGSGNVYISDTPVIGTGTDVIQTIDSWSDTSIQFDSDLSGIPDGLVYIIVQNDSGGFATWGTNKGVASYTEVMTLLSNAPDHYHTFNDTYADEIGGLAANGLSTAGTEGFFTEPLTRGRTHSWGVTGTASRIEMLDSQFTNVTNTHRRRFIGGWFEFPSTPLDPKGIWEEGGNVNNIYMVIGFGGKLLCNVADSSNGFKLQAFSDFLLTPNRIYHIGLLFDGDLGCRCYVDGVLQSGFDGAAPASDQATHTGDYSYGQPDGSLDTGGTDISYPSFSGSRYNDWATWSDAGNDVPSASDIRVEIFEKGAIPQVDIPSDTVANMQTALDVLSGNTYEDVTFAIRLGVPTDTNNPTFDLTNITFGDRTSIQLMWMGTTGETATIINRGGSNAISSRVSTAYGGAVVLQEEVSITFTAVDAATATPIEGARIRVTAAVGGSATVGDVLLEGLTNSSGEITGSLVYIADQPISGVIRRGSSSTYYRSTSISGTITSSGFESTVFMIKDE